VQVFRSITGQLACLIAITKRYDPSLQIVNKFHHVKHRKGANFYFYLPNCPLWCGVLKNILTNAQGVLDMDASLNIRINHNSLIFMFLHFWSCRHLRLQNFHRDYNNLSVYEIDRALIWKLAVWFSSLLVFARTLPKRFALSNDVSTIWSFSVKLGD